MGMFQKFVFAGQIKAYTPDLVMTNLILSELESLHFSLSLSTLSFSSSSSSFKQDKKKGNSLLFMMNVSFVIKGMLLSSLKQWA